ncbi:MAG: OmpA family protein, partial [Terriglobia bacterium]
LDQLIQQAKGLKHYAIQVQGYTDTSGPKGFNLQLSQRRAQAVVRYLTLNGDIPLVKVYSLGYGEAAPAVSNRTRKGRQQNRRVDVTIMVPQIPGQQTSQSAQAQPAAGASQ